MQHADICVCLASVNVINVTSHGRRDASLIYEVFAKQLIKARKNKFYQI